jgi:hypothetical protein
MNLPPNLNRLARLYRWMELFSFGPWLWWCRCAYLDDLLGCRHALLLGDGDGRFTARLLGSNPLVEIDAVDASEAMLRALVRHAGPHAPRVRAHCDDVRLWEPTRPPYDLVVTHFFLDFLTGEEVRSLAAKLRSAVSPSAMWLVSEFAVPENRFGRLVARPIVCGLYWSFAQLTGLTVRTLPDHCAALHEAGFALGKRRVWLGGLLVSELWLARQVPPISSEIVSG